MLKDIEDILKGVQETKEFNTWIRENNNSYLCSVFRLSEDNSNWQIDYYNPETKMITSFLKEKNVVVINTDKIFGKNHTINELKIENVRIDITKAMESINTLLKDKYKSESPYKSIVILQDLQETLWNITLIMQSLNILNIRISATTGIVLEEKMSSIFSFTSSGSK